MGTPETALKIILTSLVFLVFLGIGKNAYAGTILQRPTYFGLNQGLVGFWSFDTQSMGTTSVDDISPSGNRGFLVNGPQKTIGKIGQALNFDGINDYVDLDNPTKLNNIFTRGGTISAWIYIRTFGDNTAGRILDKQQADVGWLFFLNTNNRLAFLYNFDPVGATWLTPNGSLERGKWHHVAVTFSSASSANDPRMYIDGVEVTVDDQTPSGNEIDDTGQVLTIGDRTATDRSFDGSIDELRVYGRILSPDEVRRLYTMGGTTKLNVSQKSNLNQGLVGYWTFDAANMGTTSANDLSGNGNSAYEINGPRRVLGKIGQGVGFHGGEANNREAYVSVPDSAMFTPATTLTAAAWIKADKVAQNAYAAILAKRYDLAVDPYNSYIIDTTASGNSPEFCVSTGVSGSQTCVASGTLTTSWTHVAGTYDGARIRLFVNGRLVSSAVMTGSIGYTSLPLTIGDNQDNGSNQSFEGIIDDVRIYDRALGEDEIRRLYNMGGTTKLNVSQKYNLNQGLAGYWTFDAANMGTTSASDLTNNGNRGFLTNGSQKSIGKIGQGVVFDGVNDCVNVPYNAAFDFGANQDFTVAAWVNSREPANASDFPTVLSKEDANGTRQGYNLVLHNVTDDIRWYFELFVGGVSFKQFGRSDVADGEWHHVVGVRSGENTLTYEDGVLANKGVASSGSVAKTTPLSFGRLATGCSSSASVTSLNGRLDDIRIYDRALTEEEIRRLYNMGR